MVAKEGWMGGDGAMAPMAVSPRQAATMLGCAPSTVYWLVNQGRLRAVRLGDRKKSPMRISLLALREFLDGNETESVEG